MSQFLDFYEYGLPKFTSSAALSQYDESECMMFCETESTQKTLRL